MARSFRSILHLTIFCALGGLATGCGAPASAELNTVGRPDQESVISPEDAAAARTHDRMLDASQLSERIRSVLGITGPEAFGDLNHPFTTKRASSLDSSTPVGEFPWRATGKLQMRFGADTFVCTASVIRKNLLVTAAHCVHNFGDGQAGFADAVTYQPARHEGSLPFGTWTAKEWWIPTVYFDGSDVCTPEAPGVVCENDIAVVVLEASNGQAVGDLTGMYDFPTGDDEFGYTDFLGQTAAQITQLGYPALNFDGDKMIRTDSLGYQDAPNNVIIGSNQTGGSSGGPWLQNFGIDPSFTGPPSFDDQANQVVATTSWGFTSGTAKVQGASRFAKNTTYTTVSNIESLVASACGANPDAC